ncbi:heat shock protein, putative [Leishmania panamensis]|uniref:Heat shock protein, putative n=3 Tax=Leishmania guyanensis species complex TaxID=38579 RepID=A0A088SKC9_LEIPA|nr:heat shock protein, putative [Leishmania panamensis]AIO02272.1 heat shock protein, putative [Leishmania panamensis]
MWRTRRPRTSAASATFQVSSRQVMCCRAVLRTRASFVSGAASTHGCVPLVAVRRWCVTTRQRGSAPSGAPSTDGEAVVRAAKWNSSNFEERLGFSAGETITEERLKRHYYLLAKHYHPDTAAGSAGSSGAAHSSEASAGSAGAFQNIKEAYDVINGTLRRGGRWGGNTSGGSSAAEFARGFEYSDGARRRAQMRLLGDAVLLFMFTTVAFIIIVSGHNKSRMQSRYLWHLVGIFFIIQLFPRLLAAAILFAVHSLYLLERATLQEQAAISLIVERTERACSVKLDGLSAEAQPHVVVQVTTTAESNAAAVEAVSSTLTFDKGITAFTLPVPVDSSSVYYIKAVDEARKIVLVDRALSAGMQAPA